MNQNTHFLISQRLYRILFHVCKSGYTISNWTCYVTWCDNNAGMNLLFLFLFVFNQLQCYFKSIERNFISFEYDMKIENRTVTRICPIQTKEAIGEYTGLKNCKRNKKLFIIMKFLFYRVCVCTRQVAGINKVLNTPLR